MTTAATSTAHHGATGPHPGVPASRRDRHGTGRFRRPVGRGTDGPINYYGYNETPIWNPQFNQFGFNFFGVWIPL